VASLGSKNFHQRICVAPTDLLCLQSNPSIALNCPAEISGLSNHNTESVRASSDAIGAMALLDAMKAPRNRLKPSDREKSRKRQTLRRRRPLLSIF
jgi:hypothetical protein